MRAFFEENRSQLPPRPPIVSFRQIVLDARADTAARARAFRLADSLVGELRRGTDFAALAKRHSDDSTTRESGGELGWFRRGVMVKPFEIAAFSLRPGEISAPVESPFGLHIIKVDRIQPAEILARHILIVPELSAEQRARARQFADSIRAALVAGAPFDQLAQRYTDPLEPRLTEDVPISQLPSDYQAAIEADASLGLRPVLEMTGGTHRVRFVILDILKRQAAGPVEFEDVKARIRARLADQLALDLYLKRMRRETYVDIRL
jgi:peptidyl-prolyl cis-trans isomerase SurA